MNRPQCRVLSERKNKQIYTYIYIYIRFFFLVGVNGQLGTGGRLTIKAGRPYYEMSRARKGAHSDCQRNLHSLTFSARIMQSEWTPPAKEISPKAEDPKVNDAGSQEPGTECQSIKEQWWSAMLNTQSKMQRSTSEREHKHR